MYTCLLYGNFMSKPVKVAAMVSLLRLQQQHNLQSFVYPCIYCANRGLNRM